MLDVLRLSVDSERGMSLSSRQTVNFSFDSVIGILSACDDKFHEISVWYISVVAAALGKEVAKRN